MKFGDGFTTVNIIKTFKWYTANGHIVWHVNKSE